MTEEYTKTLLETEATIRTLYFMWRFPFIKIVDFTASIKDMQKINDTLFNLALDNAKRHKTKIYNK